MTGSRNHTAGPKKDAALGTWGFVVDVSTVDGKRKQARRRGFSTKRAAQEEMDRLRVSVTERTYVAPQRQTLASFIRDDWLPASRMNLEESTWASYARNLRLHVLPHLGDLQLTMIDAGHLNRLYAQLLIDGRKDNEPGGLSPRTVRYVATIIHAAMKDAVDWGRLVRNPADAARPPRARDAKAPAMHTWSAAELEEFLRRSEGNRYQPAWTVLALTAMRRGEVLGLSWADVDLDAARVSIRRTVTAIEHRIKIGGQTKGGRARVIEVDGRTVSALRSWRAQQAQERLVMGAGWTDLGLVFTLPDGRPYHPERFSREFARMIERLGMDPIRLHDLRHGWATLALKAGVPLKVVSERLGHTTTAITADVYSHVSPGMQTDAAEKVASLIFGQLAR